MNRNDLFFSIEQCKHLQELGFDMSDAAHFWCSMKLDTQGHEIKKREWYITLDKSQMHCGFMTFEYIPTYTLQEALRSLPKAIKHIPIDMYTLDLDLGDRECISYDGGCSNLKYFCIDGNELDAVYNMIIWCLNNKYL